MITIPPELFEMSHAERLAVFYAVLEDTPFDRLVEQTNMFSDEVLAHDQSPFNTADLEQQLAERLPELQSIIDQLGKLYGTYSVDEFVGFVSGALRDDLCILELYQHLLLKGKPEKRAHYRQVLRQRALRLQNLASDVSLFAQLDRGTAALQLAPADLNELLSEVVAGCQTQALERNLSLTLELQPDVGLAELDTVWITRALHDVLTNMLQGASAGDIIVCRTARRYEAERSWLTINLKFGQEWLHGLGRIMAREVLERHGGRLTKDNVSERSATFVFWFPPVVTSSPVSL